MTQNIYNMTRQQIKEICIALDLMPNELASITGYLPNVVYQWLDGTIQTPLLVQRLLRMLVIDQKEGGGSARKWLNLIATGK